MVLPRPRSAAAARPNAPTARSPGPSALANPLGGRNAPGPTRTIRAPTMRAEPPTARSRTTWAPGSRAERAGGITIPAARPGSRPGRSNGLRVDALVLGGAFEPTQQLRG